MEIFMAKHGCSEVVSLNLGLLKLPFLHDAARVGDHLLLAAGQEAVNLRGQEVRHNEGSNGGVVWHRQMLHVHAA
jgi:hypothetical protein